MILFTGLAFLVFWLLLSVFAVEVIKAALVTAIIFIVLGLILEGAPKTWPWDKRP